MKLKNSIDNEMLRSRNNLMNALHGETVTQTESDGFDLLCNTFFIQDNALVSQLTRFIGHDT
jgi:hypothetical protein